MDRGKRPLCLIHGEIWNSGIQEPIQEMASILTTADEAKLKARSDAMERWPPEYRGVGHDCSGSVSGGEE